MSAAFFSELNADEHPERLCPTAHICTPEQSRDKEKRSQVVYVRPSERGIITLELAGSVCRPASRLLLTQRVTRYWLSCEHSTSWYEKKKEGFSNKKMSQ